MSKTLVPGSVLLSVPQMLDPNFMHTVVLLCEHGEEGAFGLVLNRETGVTIDELLPGHPQLAGVLLPVFDGGPVGRDGLQFLHRVPEHIPGGARITSELWLGGELEALATYLRDADEPERDLRLFLGYSGWGAGQLDEELGSGSWVVTSSDPDLPFSAASSEATWRRVMRSLGRDGEGLSQLPPDVSWN